MATWILHCVITHPYAQEKIYQEVTSVLQPGQLPTFADLQKMPYMKACVKETLRYQSVSEANWCVEQVLVD